VERLGRHYTSVIDAAVQALFEETDPPAWLGLYVKDPRTPGDVTRATYVDSTSDFVRVAATNLAEYRARCQASKRAHGPGHVLPVRENGAWVLR
jgi:hypothetical protein